ncbi:MAG: aminotransferase class V-fold PLP-dependent enzyme [Bacteroidota bacterium]
MLTCQKDQFDLPESVTYLNGAYMSPLLKKVADVGRQGLDRKRQPFRIFTEDFFAPVDAVKQSYARLINAPDWERIAINPSVSYGMANVRANIKVPKGKKNIVMAGGQFPSNYYPWKRLAKEHQLDLCLINAPKKLEGRGALWNEQLLEAITDETLLVAIGHIHWTDGTLFDLETIGQQCRKKGALLIIDGTQSVGALPFDLEKIRPDALICAAYKWLMGPYSIGLSYFGAYFDQGIPIEDSWMNRIHSDDFKNLVNYQEQYRSKAARYAIGEQSNFMAIPMLKVAIDQLLEWGVNNIQDYCRRLIQSSTETLANMGCHIEHPAYRAAHLFGFRVPEGFDMIAFQEKLKAKQIFVSLRGEAIRVSPSVYNEARDFDRLLACLRETMN